MTPVNTTKIVEQVRGYFDQGPLKSYVGGAWVQSSGGETLDVIDPGSGEKIVDVFAMQAADVDAAVQAGAEAFRSTPWATISPDERAVYLHRLADLIDRDFDKLADIEALDCGKLRANSPLDIQVFSGSLRYYADLSVKAQYETPLDVAGHEARIVRLPYGVCGFIFPWNFPFWLMGWGIAPALAAGNTIVIKPAEDTPLSTLYLCRLVAEAGLPDGVVNVVAGYGEPAGASLAQHPGFDTQAQMGPVVSDAQRQRILSYLERGQAEGAEALLPGGVCDVSGCEGGFYVKPALLGGSLDNVAAREEIFGPVAYVTRFRDEAEAIQLTNQTTYGLANSVWSTDLQRCDRVAREMVAGTSWVNTHNTFPPGVPFSGVNLSGFGGGVNSAETFYDYLRDLAVVRPTG